MFYINRSLFLRHPIQVYSHIKNQVINSSKNFEKSSYFPLIKKNL